MIKKLVATAGASLLLAAPAAAATWRTGLVASNADQSSFVLIWDMNRTTLANVHALRVRLASSMPIKLTAEVKCDRGENSASRKLTYNQSGGTHLRVLPVPLPGGVCSVSLDVNGSDAGRYDMLLQYR